MGVQISGMWTTQRRHGRFVASGCGGLVVRACSTSPAETERPTCDNGASRFAGLGALTESIEQALTSGSVNLDAINAVLINIDGQTVVTLPQMGESRTKPSTCSL